MTNEQLRQLEAEADAYQADADARRDRDMAMVALQNEIIILRTRLGKAQDGAEAWRRAFKYESAARSRLERMIEFHKFKTVPSDAMIADLASAKALADDRKVAAERIYP